MCLTTFCLGQHLKSVGPFWGNTPFLKWISLLQSFGGNEGKNPHQLSGRKLCTGLVRAGFSSFPRGLLEDFFLQAPGCPCDCKRYTRKEKHLEVMFVSSWSTFWNTFKKNVSIHHLLKKNGFYGFYIFGDGFWFHKRSWKFLFPQGLIRFWCCWFASRTHRGGFEFTHWRFTGSSVGKKVESSRICVGSNLLSF